MRLVKTKDEVDRLLAIYKQSTYQTMRTFTVTFATDADVIRKLLPPPLEPAEHPIAFAMINHTAWADCSGPVLGATVQVLCQFQGVVGTYCVAMQMSTDHAVFFGRDLFGEPKKVASIRMETVGNQFFGSVERYGITFIEISGEIGEAVEAGPEQAAIGYLFKYLPDCSGSGLEDDPRLVRVNYGWTASVKKKAIGTLVFRESVHDPIIDLPIRQVVDCSYEVGQLRASAKVIGRAKKEEFLPYAFLKIDAFDQFN